MTIIVSTGFLAIIVALCVVAALLVRVCERLDVMIKQGSSRREWKGER